MEIKIAVSAYKITFRGIFIDMYRDRIKEEKQRLGISARAMSLQSVLHIQEETISRFLSGKTVDPSVGVVLDLGATVGLKPYEIFMDATLASEFAAFLELRSKSEETEAERIRMLAEIEALRATNATLAAEIELMRIHLAHRDELISHKDKIISLYESTKRE